MECINEIYLNDKKYKRHVNWFKSVYVSFILSYLYLNTELLMISQKIHRSMCKCDSKCYNICKELMICYLDQQSNL